jgi:polyferredoxin
MTRAWRLVSQVFFAALFLILAAVGKIQLWMGIFIFGVVLTVLFGRVYCGWICPINTLMNLVTGIKRKFGIKGLVVPGFIRRPVYRYIVFAVFIVSFIFVMLTGKKLPVLPGLLVLGVFLTFFFPENLWHRYLCPYGTILRAAGKLSRRSYQIVENLCISCGVCERICPADAVEVSDFVQQTPPPYGTVSRTSAPNAAEFSEDAVGAGVKIKYSINKSECLACGACALSCHKNAITYK